MKVIRADKGESLTEDSWPRHKVKCIECRKRDVVVRIADWTRDRDEPAYDVEVYVAGVFDWNESETFRTRDAGRSKATARSMAVEFAAAQIKRFLK